MRAVILLIATFLQAFASAAEDPAIAALFKAEGVEGTIVVASLKSGETFVANEKRAAQPFAPASTFKVLNTLIAVEEGIVRDKDHAFRWDGVSRDIPEWNRDQTLASAFKVSCVWC
jgi:beta-lactamase class D